MNKKEKEVIKKLSKEGIERFVITRPEYICTLLNLIKDQEKEIKVNNLMLKLKDKKLNEYKDSIPKSKIIELLDKNSKFNFISKKEIEELLNVEGK